MKPNTASRTAQYMALFRALETVRPADKQLFNDPYAISFLDKRLKRVVKLSSLPLLRALISKIIHRKIPGALTSGIARTKYIDELLQQTIHNGVKQALILGAGFDTRALRLDFLKSTRLIEIDHPDTARLKLDILQRQLKKMPDNTSYFQIDFTKESLEETAVKNNIDFSTATTVIWEGVTNYLTQEAVDNTFRFAANFVKGSYIIFTYVDKEVLRNPASFYGATKLLNDLAAIEEHWTFGFNPEELPAYLEKFNFKLIEDLGATEYRDKYLPGRKEKGYEFYRVAFAEKK